LPGTLARTGFRNPAVRQDECGRDPACRTGAPGGYVCELIALGSNTDPYQPIERRYRITRAILELLAACAHPFSIVTRNALVERALDLLAPLAQRGRGKGYLSGTTLDNRLAARMEPRASAPHQRVEAIRRLAAAGVPSGVMFAPIIPMLNDAELEAVLESCRDAGASSAGYVLLRLPHELRGLFRDWLQNHYPDRAEHILSLSRQPHGGANTMPASVVATPVPGRSRNCSRGASALPTSASDSAANASVSWTRPVRATARDVEAGPAVLSRNKISGA
jgi:DNA repair photolyase